jgi:hypothetical protein
MVVHLYEIYGESVRKKINNGELNLSTSIIHVLYRIILVSYRIIHVSYRNIHAHYMNIALVQDITSSLY